MTRTDAELLAAARQDPARPSASSTTATRLDARRGSSRQTGSETAALDLTAETFAQAWHASRRFKDMADGSGAPWLFGIARNLLRQYHKHNRIESAARERLGLPARLGGVRGLRGASTSACTATSLAPAAAAGGARAAERAAHGARAAGRQQLDYEEVAGALGCSQNAARLRVSRALARAGDSS